MARSLRGPLQTRKTFRLALSGAAVSLALAAMLSGAEALPIACDDDPLNDNFTCGGGSSTVGGLQSIAVGDQATATAHQTTAVGSLSSAASASATAVGSFSSAKLDGTAVGSGADAVLIFITNASELFEA